MKLINDRSTRKVPDSEISEYQGTGDRQAMLRAQSRKRRQARLNDPQPMDVMGLIQVVLFVGAFGFMLITVLASL